MNINEVKKIFTKYNLAFNRMYGQHFLCDSNYLKKIVKSINPKPYDIILEIGPGIGILTDYLLEKIMKIDLVEIDKGFYNVLSDKYKDKKNVKIIHEDILKYKFVENYSKIIGNLPYNISSNIIFKIAENTNSLQCFFLVQKELANRMVARPGSKMYSAFTLHVNLYYKSEILFHIPPGSFYPKPKVVSSFIKLTKHDINYFDTKEQLQLFNNIVQAAFWGRRKSLKVALSESPFFNIKKDIIIDIIKNDLNLDESVRGEELSFEEFIKFTRIIYEFMREHNQ